MAKEVTKRKKPREADEDTIARDKAIVKRMRESGEDLPLDYMSSNMHWYAKEAQRYEALALACPPDSRFRNKKTKAENEARKKHYEVMAIKMRALNQAAAETSANYVHARIQSVSIGNARGNKPLVVLVKGLDANL